MISHYNDLSDKGVVAKIFLVGIGSLVPECLTYPLDRLKVRAIARQKNTSGNSFLQYKEIGVIAKEIIAKENPTGLYYGVKSACDLVATSVIIRFLTYDFLLGRYGFDESNGYQEPSYREKGKYQIMLATMASSTFAAFCTQPSEILKIKTQLEPLGDQEMQVQSYREKINNVLLKNGRSNTIFYQPGLIDKIIFKNAYFLTEIGLFFQLSKRLIPENEIGYSQTSLYTTVAGIAGGLSTLITHPLEFIYHRQVIRSLVQFEELNMIKYSKVVYANEGIAGFYKGVAPSVMKNVGTNMLFMSMLQAYQNYGGNDLARRDIEKKQLNQKWKRGTE